MSITVSVEVNPRVAIVPVATEEKYRRQVRNSLFGSPLHSALPAGPPDLIETGYTPAYPDNIYAISSPNLVRIDRYTWHVATNVTVFAYHYVQRLASKYLAISHEGHSFFNLPNHEYHANRLLNLGWNVVLVQMPQVFSNPADHTTVVGHNSWCFPAEVNDPGFVRTFFKPTFLAKNYLKATYGYTKFAMIGISGGGWTSSWIAAMDPDFTVSFCIAGNAPFGSPWPNPGGALDYEQLALDGYQGFPGRPVYKLLPLNNLDLFAMAADNARLFRLIYVENESPPYFPSFGLHPVIDSFVAQADVRVNGTVAVSYDTTQTVHEISAFSGDVIVSDLLSMGMKVTGPTGAPITDPSFTNLIAWYRGDGMSAGQLIDRSGNANHAIQATPANQGAVVLFDANINQQVIQLASGGAGDDFYQVAAVKVGGINPIAYTEYSIVAVYKVPQPLLANGMIFASAAASGTTRPQPFLYHEAGSSGRGVFGLNTDAIAVTGSGTVVTPIEWIWVVGTHVGAQRQIWVNGVLKTTTVSADSTPALTRIGIGRSMDASPFYPFNGLLAEIVFTGHALTASEIAGLGSYLNARYGI